MAEVKRSNSWKGIAIAVGAAVIGFGLMALLLRGSWSQTAPQQQQPAQGALPVASQTQAQAGAPQASPAAAAAAQGPGGAWVKQDRSELEKIIDSKQFPAASAGHPTELLDTLASVIIRLTLAALLAAMLAFRPRRFALFTKRNPFVAQTQILLAVVASALMMVVGDSAARAFGIFAAASLVRFRTNIKDPKEITVLLLSLAIGLATGVGRWELALILAFFSLLLLWGLEYREPELVHRSMELSVATRDADRTQDVLLQIFKKHGFDAELRTIERPDGGDSLGNVVYNVNVSPLISTDRLSDEILVADPDNVDKVEWSQQKTTSYFYQ
ncbi:MAG TPA: DUF4956 domain-containing protein [Pyrinomonadaceae bacterium]|jgi:hypothetical protein|nr:DUF4956 domain-containing protein [Pyrinomonadaceae bacterium]